MTAAELIDACEVTHHHMREAMAAMRNASAALSDLVTAMGTLIVRSQAAAAELAVYERVRATAHRPPEGGGL